MSRITITLSSDNPLYPFATYLQRIEHESQSRAQEVDKLLAALELSKEAVGIANEELQRAYNRIEALTIPEWRRRVDQVLTAGLYAMHLRIPYVFGAEYHNNKAFDCSAFMQSIFAFGGVSLPRASYQQAEKGIEVPLGEERPGDGLYIDTSGNGKVNHTGVVIEKGKMLHTAGHPEGLNICDYMSRYGREIVTVRRFIT